jgi:type II secretory pathway component PulM
MPSKDNTILGLTFDGRVMSAVLVRQTGDGVQVMKHCEPRLSLDPISSEPELVGREIRGHLDAAEIRARPCVVAIPLSWALAARIDAPELSGEDLASFIGLQAEREFPFSPSDLSLSVRMPEPGATDRQAIIAALPLNRLAALERMLHAAGLKPVSITLAVTSLGPNHTDSGAVVLLAAENAIDLCVTTRGGVAALRALEGPTDQGADGFEFDAEALARELRITLRQLSETSASEVGQIHLAGPAALTGPLRDELADCQPLPELPVSLDDYSDVPNEATWPAYGAAARRVRGDKPVFEFLPPRLSPLKRFVSGAANRGVRWLTPVAVAAFLLISGLFLYQHQRLEHLESRWEEMRENVAGLEETQNRIRAYRDWFSDGAPSLEIAQALTEAFPEEGSVWARTVSLKGRGQVTCTGHARSDAAWLAMLSNLRQTQSVTELKVGQVSGDAPLQFSISYCWKDK